MESSTRKAVIDVGSNSVLLLAEEQTAEGWKTLTDLSKVTGLGEGVKQTGVLKPEAMERTLDAVKTFFGAAESLGCAPPLACATMAARLASNQKEFLDLAKAQGTPIQVLSGADEAQLGFESAASDPMFSSQNIIATVDPGGQSTELTIAKKNSDEWEKTFSFSFPVGTLGLRAGALSDESPSHQAWFEAMMAVDKVLASNSVPEGMFDQSQGAAVILGASATNLVSIRDEVVPWDPFKVHGAQMTYGEISLMIRRLGELDDAGRASLPGIERGREKTVHIGALIIERFLFEIGAKWASISVKGWRYALLEHGLPG